MQKLLLIMAGGAVGSLLRYLLSGWGQRIGGGSFPWGTLLVNVVGCLLIGALGALFSGPQLIREEYRVALLVGFLGALTTFSTFGWESFALVNERQWSMALLNVAASNGLALSAVWLGFRVAEKWWGV
jgi:CrcB protein